MTSSTGTTTTTSSGPPSAGARRRALDTEVVVGLVNDGSARSVATAGLDHALLHDMSVSFVHVIARGGTQGADDVGDTTFAAVLDAMRGHGRLRCAFEVLRGDPYLVLVERSRGAGLLVIGSDASSTGASVADSCRLHAECPVLTVDGVGPSVGRTSDRRQTT